MLIHYDPECRRQMDVVFVLDMSSNNQGYHERARRITKQIVNNLDFSYGRVRVGLITYGASVTTQFHLNTYSSKGEVCDAISFVPQQGRSNTRAALQRMRSELFGTRRGNRPGVPDIAILLTDNFSTQDSTDTIHEAYSAKAREIALNVIALGDGVDMSELEQVAGNGHDPPERYVYRVREDSDVEEVVYQLTDRLCHYHS